MKLSILVVVFFAGVLYCTSVASQNVSINVLTQESGIVKKGKTIFFEVTINNTDASIPVGIYKLKAQINVGDSVVGIQQVGHNLPTGWEILNNVNGVITVSNGKDLIAPNDSRTLLIALKGKKIGGPVIISGKLNFSNGIAPGVESGFINEDKPADNYSTSSCKVIK
jgi:hypothetical protein